MNQDQVTRLELYKKASTQYELGTPIMSDTQYDILEAEVKLFAPDEVKKVGANAKGQFKHWSPLLSLAKIKVMDPAVLPMDEFEAFFKKFHPNTEFETGPKFDGNASNLQYLDGKLVHALSRSDEATGYDRMAKLLSIVPATIPMMGRVEIRGEIVMPQDIFEAKYMKSALNPEGSSNERNYVAGLLSSDDLRLTKINELCFMAIELRKFDDATDNFRYMPNSMQLLTNYGFNVKHPVEIMTFRQNEWRNMIPVVYAMYADYRANKSPFRLDGFVIKAEETVRLDFGFNSHDPNWAVAVKFPPKDAITELLSHEWKTGATGKISPVAILEPIDLDGSIVTRATLHNWGHIVDNKLYPGAKVLIAKSGDIIPRIYKVITPSANPIPHPANCPSCGGPVTYFDINETQLYCANQACPARNITRLAEGIKVLGMDNIGESTAEALFNAGIITIQDLFDNTKFNKQQLITSGIFNDGRALDIILASRAAVTEIHLCHVIESLKITDVGTKLSKQLAKHYSKAAVSTSGLNKNAWSVMTDVNSNEFKQFMTFLQTLKAAGIKVILEVDDSHLITFEMTGEPPMIDGMKDKNDWAAEFERYGCRHTSLTKDTHYLITDSHSSTTGKMSKAYKYQTPIMTYEEFRQYLIDYTNNKSKP